MAAPPKRFEPRRLPDGARCLGLELDGEAPVRACAHLDALDLRAACEVHIEVRTELAVGRRSEHVVPEERLRASVLVVHHHAVHLAVRITGDNAEQLRVATLAAE